MPGTEVSDRRDQGPRPVNTAVAVVRPHLWMGGIAVASVSAALFWLSVPPLAYPCIGLTVFLVGFSGHLAGYRLRETRLRRCVLVCVASGALATVGYPLFLALALMKSGPGLNLPSLLQGLADCAGVFLAMTGSAAFAAVEGRRRRKRGRPDWPY